MRCIVFVLFWFLLHVSLASIGGTRRVAVTLVKIGGSSITDKAKRETLRPEALAWTASALSSGGTKSNGTCSDTNYVLVHGAGSFGHFSAKEHSLSGINIRNTTGRASDIQTDGMVVDDDLKPRNSDREYSLTGVAKTRLSVQTLNHLVAQHLVDQGVPAVAISPCFGALIHGNGDMSYLASVVYETVAAGLVPVLHGDACLVHSDMTRVAGILSGDIIMEELGQLSWVKRAVFVTDVDGVFTSDPRIDPNAELLETIEVDQLTGRVLTEVKASESSHEHDVTGGLETKLGAAVSIAQTGKDVIIVKCQSQSAERAIQGDADFGVGSRIRSATPAPIKA